MSWEEAPLQAFGPILTPLTAPACQHLHLLSLLRKEVKSTGHFAQKVCHFLKKAWGTPKYTIDLITFYLQPASLPLPLASML